MKNHFQKWGWLALALFTFFFLLGSRSLNEPDEGRYSEIAREMIETGDWLVPHLWYLPHLDKPPMTYWFVAASIKILGQNEWAVRLPVALAGISGVFATFLFGCALGGRRVGIWAAIILQSSLLYFIAARVLTPDILLAQFIAWAVYFFWQSWQEAKVENRKWKAGKFFAWHLAGWVAIALGFLTKGPIALAIPLVAFVPLVVFRRREIPGRILVAGSLCGFVLFFALAAPWFLAIFKRVPESAHFMILGQAAGHLLGTTIKNRTGSPAYFFEILALGFLPWTILLGWLWRRNHWRNLDARSKDGWLLLSVWAIFTFVLFSLSQSKLPAYILPIFPALAVLLAWRFFDEDNPNEVVPAFVWRAVLASSMLLPAIFPLVMKFIFHEELSKWLNRQPEIVAVEIVFVLSAFCPKDRWPSRTVAASAAALALIGFFVVVAEIPQFETSLRRNQTFKPLGLELKKNFQPGDAVVCWGRFPQGLPFYSGGVIYATNRPYLGGMDLTQVPLAFPGNRERLGDLLLPDGNALALLLKGGGRVWVVVYGDTIEGYQKRHPDAPLRPVARSGEWQLFSSR
jgi:4-amino-4-deoxy-L-arabinose transferase-like glycosyltransferase